MNKYPSVTFRIDQGLLEALDKAAEYRGVSRSNFINAAITIQIAAYLDEVLYQ